MADPVSIALAVGSTLVSAGAITGTAATIITAASIGYTLYSAFSTRRLPDAPRLGDLSVQTSTYGSAIPRVYGTDVVRGNIIWLRDNQITESFKTVKVSKKDKQKVPTYSATFALALGEGIVSKVLRIWIDGRIVYDNRTVSNIVRLKKTRLGRTAKGKLEVTEVFTDVTTVTDELVETVKDLNFRFYKGDYTQQPDPTMLALDPDADAYRGISYLFFDRLNLTKYGNRIPDMQIEVLREAPSSEGQTTVPIQVNKKYFSNDYNSVGYELLSLYTNNLPVPKAQVKPATSNTTQAVELYSFEMDWLTNRDTWCYALKYADSKQLKTCFSSSYLSLPYEIGSTNSSKLLNPLQATYSDINNPGVVTLNANCKYIVEANIDISTTEPASFSDAISLTDGTIKQGFSSYNDIPIYPWDFPYKTNDNLSLNTTSFFDFSFFLTPVLNSKDLYIVLYRTTSSGFKLGLLKTVGSRCIVKELNGLRETIMPNYTSSVSGTGRFPMDYAAIEYKNEILLFNNRGYYKVFSNYVSDSTNLSDYVNNNFNGFVKIPKPTNWQKINEGTKSSTINSFLTTIQSNNGYYVSKQGLNEDTQITDWNWITTVNPKGFIIDPLQDKVLIINELTASPSVVANQATYFANLRLCLLDSELENVTETYTYSLPTTNQVEILNYCKITDSEIKLLFNGTAFLTINRSTLAVSSSSYSSFTSPVNLPVKLLLESSDERYTVISSDYASSRARQGDFYSVSSVTPNPNPPGPDEYYPILVRSYEILFDQKNNATSNDGAITLSEIISTEITNSGYLSTSDIDTTGTNGINVTGYVIPNQSTTIANLQALAEGYFFYLYEEDYKIKAKYRGGLTSSVTVNDSVMNAREIGQPGFLLKNNRPSTYLLPSVFEVNYRDPDLLYGVGNQYVERAGATEETKQVVELAMALSATKAKDIVTKILKQMYIKSQGEYELTLPAIYSHLEAGQMITVDSATYGTYNLLINSVDKGRPGIVKIVGVKEDPTIYSATIAQDLQAATFTDPEPYDLEVNFVIIDSLPFDSSQDGIGFYLAVWNTQGVNTGYGLIQSKDNFLTYETLEGYQIRNSAQVFSGMSPLPGNVVTGVYNNNHTLTLNKLNAESFSSVTVDNAYTAFYGNTNRWEVIRFTNVVDNGDNTYTISNILRGYKGTENLVGTHEIGDYLVIVNGALSKLNYSNDELGNSYQYRISVPRNSDQEEWPSFSFTLSGYGREPLPVTNLIGSRDSSGNLTISWTPQYRYNIQWKDRVEATSDEAINSYTLAIMNISDVVLRTVTVSNASSYVYTSAQQVSDFGSNQTSVKIGITRDSDVMGTGLLLVGSV